MWYLFKRLTGFKVNRVLIRVIVFCKCITSATQKYLYKQHDPFSLVKNTVCYNVKNKKPVQCNYLNKKNKNKKLACICLQILCSEQSRWYIQLNTKSTFIQIHLKNASISLNSVVYSPYMFWHVILILLWFFCLILW